VPLHPIDGPVCPKSPATLLASLHQRNRVFFFFFRAWKSDFLNSSAYLKSFPSDGQGRVLLPNLRFNWFAGGHQSRFDCPPGEHHALPGTFRRKCEHLSVHYFSSSLCCRGLNCPWMRTVTGCCVRFGFLVGTITLLRHSPAGRGGRRRAVLVVAPDAGLGRQVGSSSNSRSAS